MTGPQAPQTGAAPREPAFHIDLTLPLSVVLSVLGGVVLVFKIRQLWKQRHDDDGPPSRRAKKREDE